MENWQRNRGNAYGHRFQARLAELGIDQQHYDEMAPEIDGALCGSADDKLDAEYPVLTVTGLRMILTEETWSVPALRISFRVDEADNGKIVYEDIDLR